jgi:hypothetical protein
MTRAKALVISVLVIGWSFAVGAGIQRIWAYEGTPGAAQPTPASWPQGSHVERASGVPTLVMFVHPQCTCSRASLTELAELMEKNQGALHAAVLFMKPQDESQSWTQTSSWKMASTIAGIAVATDIDGSEAKRFGAATSGHLILYAADGRLLYSGGITESRGHVGDNAHLRQAMLALKTGKPQVASDPLPVYGCSLHDRQAGT